VGDKGPRAALGDGHLRSNAAFPSVSRQRDGGTWMTFAPAVNRSGNISNRPI